MSRELVFGLHFFFFQNCSFLFYITQQSPLGEPGSPAPRPLLYQHSLGEADTSFIIQNNFLVPLFPQSGQKQDDRVQGL